jgi:uncharacterized protein
MKILFTSDLHGEGRFYQELLDLARSSPSEVVALGGDLLPSFPPTKRYEDMIPHQKTFIRQFLIPFFKQIIETTSCHRIVLIPGNWDLGYPFIFDEPVAGVIDLSGKGYKLDNGYQLIGYPFVPPTPFRPKDYEKMDDPEAPWPPQKNPSYVTSSDHPDTLLPIDPSPYLRQKGTIREDLDLLPRPVDPGKTVFIMHSPPFGTGLDVVRGGRSAGSVSIRNFILKNQPLLTLHGHIHESPEISGACFEYLGETLSINPGQAETTGRDGPGLHAVLFEMESPRETLCHTCYGPAVAY